MCLTLDIYNIISATTWTWDKSSWTFYKVYKTSPFGLVSSVRGTAAVIKNGRIESDRQPLLTNDGKLSETALSEQESRYCEVDHGIHVFVHERDAWLWIGIDTTGGYIVVEVTGKKEDFIAMGKAPGPSIGAYVDSAVFSKIYVTPEQAEGIERKTK